MAILLPDARELSDAVLEAIRLRALRGCELGFSEAAVADLLGVCRETVCRGWSAYTRDGLEGLPHDRTGRPIGTGRTLSDRQAQQIRQRLDAHTPEEWGIPAPLWTRPAVRQLIQKELGIVMPVRTVGSYLRRWGYTAKRPRRHAKKQDPEEVGQWREETYPAIEERAEAEGAAIHWCDETGVGADEHPARGYAPRGRAGHDGGARSPHPDEPDRDHHHCRDGAVHDLRPDDERGPVPGLPEPPVTEHDRETLRDRGPASGSRDARGGGVGGTPPGPDRVVLPAPVRAGVERC
jgi:transposase